MPAIDGPLPTRLLASGFAHSPGYSGLRPIAQPPKPTTARNPITNRRPSIRIPAPPRRIGQLAATQPTTAAPHVVTATMRCRYFETAAPPATAAKRLHIRSLKPLGIQTSAVPTDHDRLSTIKDPSAARDSVCVVLPPPTAIRRGTTSKLPELSSIFPSLQ